MGYLAPLVGSIDSTAVAAAMTGKAAESYPRVASVLTNTKIKNT